ncbi:flavin-containing monooxygenase [Nocardia stercoris]|uniref:NAD(P)/FAD-dependent oxidoreductase n=1 Tax=Nocardia stercoris TaxID=2483361 RepID=A0A3M2L623_9NOCA|nr:NAD(P)/FAD-dependent oxidoreductase [Nocardia stercoris]RMI32170.1 NAD(P)/FAD-dependent oxidoreductase [Nocardia stercoris]
MAPVGVRAVSVAVIGCGFGGLAAVIELKRRGFDDIVVFEKAGDVGGVWRENTYPGAACDVPSPFYSFSYEPNPRWPHRFSRQPAILQYIRDVAARHDVLRHVRFGAEVTGARFDDGTGRWTVELAGGERAEFDVLVPAVGQLSRPALPDIPGRDTFAGPAFHSARWDHDVDLTGKRVAVVGTGASAVQFVPEVRRLAGHTTVFQRTAPYILPRPDREFSPLHHRLFEKLPITELVERATWFGLVEGLSVAWVYARPLATGIRAVSLRHMLNQTKSVPGLFDKIRPDYAVGCKRVLFSDDYLPALTQPDVSVVTDRITEITPRGLRTADGAEHEADVIIWGTGFRATEFLAPIAVTGAGGRDLHDEWRDGAHAYYGLTVPHFPNLVLMYGPNTNTGGGSIIYFLEAQARYLADYVEHLARTGGCLDVEEEVERTYDEEIQRRLADSVWTRCSSWYRSATGRITANWPLLSPQYRARARFRPADYRVLR